MKKRLVLAVFMTLLLSLAVSTNVFAKAQKDYFYERLTNQEKEIYTALKDNTDVLETGNEDIKLSSPGSELSFEILEVTRGNSSDLLNTFTRARDAFLYDHPEVFYVDFDQLSIRVVSENGTPVCYIGIGRSDNYYRKGFSSKEQVEEAVKKFETKVSEITGRAPQEKDEDDQTLVQTQLRYLHDYITENMVYKFQYELEKNKDKNSTRSAYDALFYGEGVCEAYTRAFKVLCDEMNIPCIAVYGQYKGRSSGGEHIWNYVQIDDSGNWYAVDVTQDDPIYYNVTGKRDTINERAKSGRETHEYFLVGSSKIAGDHLASGILSPANYRAFEYPKLSYDPPMTDLKVTGDSLTGELKVKSYSSKYDEGGESMNSLTARVSFRGAGYKESEDNGYYILMRTEGGNSVESNNGTGFTDWFYIEPELFSIIQDNQNYDEDLGGSYVELLLPHVQSTQFAVTDQPSIYKRWHDPDGDLYGKELTKEQFDNMFFYLGNPMDLITVSETVVNPNEAYVAPPYPTSTTPAMSGVLILSEFYAIPTYSMSATFNQELEYVTDASDLSIEVTAYNSMSAEWRNLDGKITLENIKFNKETNTVSWSFKPSSSYGESNAYYYFQIHGLQGKKSQKEPIRLGWGVTYEGACRINCGKLGVDRVLYGGPSLIDDPDLQSGEWRARDNETGKEVDFSEIVKDLNVRDRLTLITTTPAPGEQGSLLETLKDSGLDTGLNPEDTLDDSEVRDKVTFYQVNLSYCNKTIYQTGEKVRICLGFPNDVTYEEALKGNPSLKMYHYLTDPATGKLTNQVEEIPITITPQGLIIIVDSFSPFALVQSEGKDESQVKNVILRTSEGGTITPEIGIGGADLGRDKNGEVIPNQVDLQPNQGYTFKIKADSGKVIGTISQYIYDSDTKKVVEKLVPSIPGSTEDEITIYYEDLPEIGGMTLGVSFIDQSAETRDNDETQGRTSNFSLPALYIPNSIFINPGEEFQIEAKFREALQDDETVTYEWNRNGETLKETNSTLTISEATYEDAGLYIVTAVPSEQGEPETSNNCTVSVGYQIIFDYNNETGFTQSAVTNSNNQLERLPIPERSGFKFIGWFTEADEGEAVTTTTTFSSNTTIFAHWEEIEEPDTSKEITSIQIPESLAMKVGDTARVEVTFVPEDTEDTALTWESSDSDTVEVSNGKLTALKAGTAVIAATSVSNPDVSASCTVTVTEKETENPEIPDTTETVDVTDKVISQEAISGQDNWHTDVASTENGELTVKRYVSITLENPGQEEKSQNLAEATAESKITKDDKNYVFAGWAVDGKIITSANPYSFLFSDDVRLTPVYVEEGTEVSNLIENAVEISEDHSENPGGSVIGTGAYAKDQIVVLFAKENSGYKFIRWVSLADEMTPQAVALNEDEVTVLSTENPYAFTATEGLTVRAEFEEQETENNSGSESSGNNSQSRPQSPGNSQSGSSGPGSITGTQSPDKPQKPQDPQEPTDGPDMDLETVIGHIKDFFSWRHPNKNDLDGGSGDTNLIQLYRIYNPETGEHLVTADRNEVDTLISNTSWTEESAGWTAPQTGTPVYRLHNTQSGEHLYTTDTNEVSTLIREAGWSKDNNGNAVYYSGGRTPVYRLYNAEIGQHLLTTDRNEYESLPQHGWSQEDVKLYAVK